MNPQGWTYFGARSAEVATWEAAASQAGKEANKERGDQWLKFVKETIPGSTKAGHSFIKNLPKWRASITSIEFDGGVSERPCDILYKEMKHWSNVWDDKGPNAKVIEEAIGWVRTALSRLDDMTPGEINVACVL